MDVEIRNKDVLSAFIQSNTFKWHRMLRAPLNEKGCSFVCSLRFYLYIKPYISEGKWRRGDGEREKTVLHRRRE